MNHLVLLSRMNISCVIGQFPDTYPSQPPAVQMLNYIAHPHVIGGYICLDMLENERVRLPIAIARFNRLPP
jgi:ubiquitin-protein ligase